MLCSAWASLVIQMVKNLPAMQDAWVQSLGWKDLLENYPLCILACETIYHRLGLKPMCWDLNPAKKTHSTWLQDLMKLRFLMSHHRKNSVRNKMIGKKWIYSDTESSTLHRQSVGHRRGRMWLPNMSWLVFINWVI